MSAQDPCWRAWVLSLFPEMFPGPLAQSLAGKALQKELWRLDPVDIRDFAQGRHKSVDDTPFGGGPGMVLRADILDAAIDHVANQVVWALASPCSAALRYNLTACS